MPHDPEWPPKSPRDALLSSPSGRRRYNELLQQRQRQTSPSPRKPLGKGIAFANNDADMQASDHDDEDEETLQLQLQAIQAKLKLKKLQSKRAAGRDDASSERTTESSQPASRTGSALSASRPVVGGTVGGGGGLLNRDPAVKSILRSKSAADLLQVPLSPAKRREIPGQSPTRSPGRVLLGIDKGRSGADVSLKRPPADRQRADTLRSTTRSAVDLKAGFGAATVGAKAGRSFNERMAERRESEKENLQKKARAEALKQQRSTSFGVAKEDVEAYKKKVEGEHGIEKAESKTRTIRQPAGFSRDQIVGAAKDPQRAVKRSYDQDERRNDRDSASVGRSTTSFSQRSEHAERPRSNLLKSRHMDSSKNQSSPDNFEDEPRRSKGSDTSLYEPFSSTPLMRRILPHSFVERTLADKTYFSLTTMLKHVKAPDWELPESVVSSDSDFVVFAVVGSKSAPLDHRGSARTHDDNSGTTKTSAEEADEASVNDMKKYMVFTLVSSCFQWSVDMYLFGTGYTRWRNLSPGTLIAILNPGILPPPPGKADTNRWSLKLGSSDDTILEIGTSSEIGWCKAVKKSGQQCGAWVDATKLEYCEFHVEMNVERIRATRMDAQGGSGFKKEGKGRGRWGKKKKEDEDPNGLRYDREAQSAYYIAQTGGGLGFGGRSAASLLDLEQERGGSQEKTRRMLATKEKERELARELGKVGRGAGAEYMSKHGAGGTARSLSRKGRADTGTIGSRETQETTTKYMDAKELGLHGGKAADVQLSPLKRKQSALDLIGATGGVRKKTRFVTDRGIKVAGRESLPNADVRAKDLSDDDLEIV